MQVTAIKEIINIEKSTTNLVLARDQQIRRKTWKHNNRWNEQGSNLHVDAALIALLRQELSASIKADAPGTVTFMLA